MIYFHHASLIPPLYCVGAPSNSLCWYLICCVGTFLMALYKSWCALPIRKKKCSNRWASHLLESSQHTGAERSPVDPVPAQHMKKWQQLCWVRSGVLTLTFNVNVLLFQIFIPILHGLALAVKECSFDSDNFKFPLMVRKHHLIELDKK